MSAEEEDDSCGIPEWVVTFGDMMSLLLTFFIMLVSLSEIKEKEKYQAMVESVRRQFGYDTSTASFVPGPAKPRNSPVSRPSAQGRTQKKKIHDGGNDRKAVTGEEHRVAVLREGTRTAVGVSLRFEVGSDQLTKHHQDNLREIGSNFMGKPQKIDIRGHTSKHPNEASENDPDDHWDLAYSRCRKVMDFLVNDYGIKPERIRISVAGPHEPRFIDPDPLKMAENPRVEVYLLDEVASNRIGTESERNSQFRESNK